MKKVSYIEKEDIPSLFGEETHRYHVDFADGERVDIFWSKDHPEEGIGVELWEDFFGGELADPEQVPEICLKNPPLPRRNCSTASVQKWIEENW